ncbi:lysophospholipid acyltransferase family protein [Ampullimonas aquatilis]|uniref:lysophospholipid acyltransferase family protein n=1 Tax=Ampullimonas aquatilis TaxID=1341549 RepID=UPI003C793480
MLFIRSLIFFLFQTTLTIVMGGPLLLLTVPFSPLWRYRLIMRPWCKLIIKSARLICGIKYEFKGMENLPDAPAVLLSKHQSAWETIALPAMMPRPLCFVFKRELLRIPFFGWSIGLMKMIHIDRNKGSKAFAEVVQQGKDRLAEGRWIIMFPEGTRIARGKTGKYKSGGARLAKDTNVPVIPIALSAARCWPKNSFIKYPGTITVSIGQPISPVDLTTDELNTQVENWIENEMHQIDPDAYPNATASQAAHVQAA